MTAAPESPHLDAHPLARILAKAPRDDPNGVLTGRWFARPEADDAACAPRAASRSHGTVGS